jgi:hypothetical protein
MCVCEAPSVCQFYFFRRTLIIVCRSDSNRQTRLNSNMRSPFMSTEMLSFRLRLIFNVSAGEKVENDTDDCTLFTSKQEIIELAFISTMPSFTKGRILEMTFTDVSANRFKDKKKHKINVVLRTNHIFLDCLPIRNFEFS